MMLKSFIEAMPKAELHVHLEGSIRPATLLALARRHGVTLPADTIEGLQAWYRFTSFAHFVEVYVTILECLRTPDDIELLAREFLADQARQNILYSEVTYTAYSHWRHCGLPFADQLAALNRARAWAAAELGVTMNLVLDIARNWPLEEALVTADWAIAGLGNGVVGLGLAGPEEAAPPSRFRAAFDRARAAGLHSLPHAGEHEGADSIWGALRDLSAERIGHGVRCLEDPALVAELRERQIPLEVCPSSNVALGVAPDWPGHQLPRLLDAGLYVTLNSDDPPLFNTTLTAEYLRAAETFRWDQAALARLALNALHASVLPAADRAALETRFRDEMAALGVDGAAGRQGHR